MAIVSVGIDLAKNAFAAHGVDQAGKPVLVRSRVPRAKLLEPIAALPPCFIGTEACYGAQEYPIDWGTLIPEVRPHRAPDGAQVRHSLPPL